MVTLFPAQHAPNPARPHALCPPAVCCRALRPPWSVWPDRRRREPMRSPSQALRRTHPEPHGQELAGTVLLFHYSSWRPGDR